MAAVKEAADKPAKDAEAAQQEYEKQVAGHHARVQERRLERRRAAAESAEKQLKAAQKSAAKSDRSAHAAASVQYPLVDTDFGNVFLLGAPIGMFELAKKDADRKFADDVRLVGSDGTATRLHNIFHPYDPLACRLETLITDEANAVPPIEIPHHEGHKKLHLELEGYLKKTGAELNEGFSRLATSAFGYLQKQIAGDDQQEVAAQPIEAPKAEPQVEFVLPSSSYNGGGRVDHVLQDDTLEIATERVSPWLMHYRYWASKDTMLFMMNSMYSLKAA